MVYNIQGWLLQTIAMMITAGLIPKLKIENPFAAFLMVFALAFVNSHLWDAGLFSEIPDSPTVRALILLVANGFIFWFLVKVLPGIEVEGFLPALVAPLVFTICYILVSRYGTEENLTLFATTVRELFYSLRLFLQQQTQ